MLEQVHDALWIGERELSCWQGRSQERQLGSACRHII